jgi:hypothetical protein
VAAPAGTFVVPMFLRMTTRFATDVPADQALAWARETGVVVATSGSRPRPWARPAVSRALRADAGAARRAAPGADHPDQSLAAAV